MLEGEYMNKRVTAIFSALALIAILATAASTQAQSGFRMRITVPFDFVIGDKTYSSGPYIVEAGSNPELLRVRSTDFRETTFVGAGVLIRPSWGQDQAKLVFNRYGDRYFLNTIWLGSEGHQLLKSKLERELIKELSDDAAKAEVETVTGTPD
jgi:hypothetical protein